MATASETSKSGPKVNRLGRSQMEYRGKPSTLCKGCGHDSITSNIVGALWELGIEPHRVAKMSGIGCSSKTTTYFLDEAHGFNSVHGRMAPIATGSFLANKQLIHIGVSGDGDTASIGLGNFLHMVRRNVPMIYLIENNGVYGLTKGQFSATADVGTIKKGGVINQNEPVDCCALAIQMGCEFVGRSFSGDFKQLSALLKAAMSHRGTALLDIVSPCITFNNQEGSPKSLRHAKEHENPLHQIGFVPYQEPIQAEYEEGEVKQIDLPDGSRILLKKTEHDYDPTDKRTALDKLEEATRERLFLTGLLYHGNRVPTLGEALNLVDEPLASLGEDVVRPSADALAGVMERFR